MMPVRPNVGASAKIRPLRCQCGKPQDQRGEKSSNCLKIQNEPAAS
jgi:hypothetical protein